MGFESSLVTQPLGDSLQPGSQDFPKQRTLTEKAVKDPTPGAEGRVWTWILRRGIIAK